MILNNIEFGLWVLFGLAGVFVPVLRSSLPVLFFVSCYANAKGARSTAVAAQMQVKAEETS